MATVKGVKKNGGSKSDTLVGGFGNDTIKGNGGDDFITGGVGNDIIDGGTGKNDVAVFSGSLADYVVVTSGNTTTVTAKSGNDGIDKLTNVELLMFKDGQFRITDLLNDKPVVAGLNVNDTLSNGMPLSRYNFVGTDGNDSYTTYNHSSQNAGGFVNGMAGNDLLHGYNYGVASTTSKPYHSDTLIGGAGNDTIDGAWGADVLVGGSGVDILTGGEETAFSMSNGGAVADTFVFGVGDTSFGVNSRDIITDFSKVDVLDLSGKIIANSAGYGHLTFVGSAAFTGSNQVRFAVVNNQTIVQINLNNDVSSVEAEIELTGTVSLNASNFLLA